MDDSISSQASVPFIVWSKILLLSVKDIAYLSLPIPNELLVSRYH